MQSFQQFRPRRSKMVIGALGVNQLRTNSPWTAAWWSVALPGFGHIHMGMYTKGFILMGGEIAFNVLGQVNLALYYTFLGDFQHANQVLNYQWTTLYCAVFVFAIYDSYRITVEVNKLTWLESKQDYREFRLGVIEQMDMNYLDKRIPWVAAFWSAVFTGLGHLYSHRIVSGFLLLGWLVVVAFYSRLPFLIIYTLTGQFELLGELPISYEWGLFFPSVYWFGVVDSYEQAVSLNNLFKEEQVNYLKKKYGENALTIQYGVLNGVRTE